MAASGSSSRSARSTRWWRPSRISGFDASQTKFYDAEAGGCKMLGRGGNTYYTMTAPATNEDGPWVLDMTFYSDPLCTVKEKTVRYTLEENGSHLRFISAVAV